jgi:4-hydroxybenzoate polyprenyltransferase
LAAAAGFAFQSGLAAALLLPAAAHLLWQVRSLDIEDSARCLRLFRSNRDTGGLIALALLAGGWLGQR